MSYHFSLIHNMNNFENILNHTPIESNDITTIPLYMDQLTDYIETSLSKLKISEEDKTLTKTMINNYVKGKLIDKPVNKKYNQDQIMELIMIYHLKNILSITDLNTFFKVAKDSLDSDQDKTKELYSTFLEVQKEILENTKANFTDIPDLDDTDSKIKKILELLLQADINKRLAEIMISTL